MKVVTEKQYVPAKSYTVTKYVASDGKVFPLQRDCERYEKRLDIMKHPVIASRIDGLYTFDYEYPATLYYISSEEDYSFLTTYWLCSSRTETDFISTALDGIFSILLMAGTPWTLIISSTMTNTKRKWRSTG